MKNILILILLVLISTQYIYNTNKIKNLEAQIDVLTDPNDREDMIPFLTR